MQECWNMSEVYYWIGVGVVTTVSVAAILVALLYAYMYLINGRFQFIIFSKTERRMSLAAWYNAKLMSDEHYHADDFPISERPLFVSYRVGKRQLFFMTGFLEERRHMPISGKHPEYSCSEGTER
jgi:hypothetical protein